MHFISPKFFSILSIKVLFLVVSFFHIPFHFICSFSVYLEISFLDNLEESIM